MTSPWGPRAMTAVAILAAAAVPFAQQRPTFEAASIRLAAANAVPRNQIVPTSPNRLSIPSMTLSWLIYTAYGDGGLNTAMRVTGGPEWVNTTSYALEAVASGTPTPRERRLMLQALLEDRFALKLRIETQTVQMNTIVVDGKLGPKVTPWDGTCRGGKPTEEDDPVRPRCASGYFPGRLFLEGATMFSVAEALSLPPGRALIGDITGDRTGVAGRYTLELTYNFAPPRADADALAPAGQPALSTAVREQWGLRFERGPAPFRLVTVESAQPATAN